MIECPKCHTRISDNQTVCPVCKKVLLLECPNCHELGESAICSECGYTILVKCSKCGRISPISAIKCPKCGLSLKKSLAYQECETDDFAALVIKFENLNKIKKLLKNKDLFSKFHSKLNNLLKTHFRGLEGKIIKYNKFDYVINMNKELSFTTSANKAVRLAIKIINSFVELNDNLIQQFNCTLNLKIEIVKKTAEELQEYSLYKNNQKLLISEKTEKKYLKGFNIILDQYVRDAVNKEFKTDSLYSVEYNGMNIVFYTIILDTYILPPEKSEENETLQVKNAIINKKTKEQVKEDKYAFKVFDINAKCTFKNISTLNLEEDLNSIAWHKNSNIISIRSEDSYAINTSDIIKILQNNDLQVLTATCSEKNQYTPWGIFTEIIKDYFKIPFHRKFINTGSLPQELASKYLHLLNLINEIPLKAASPDDARYHYMDIFNKFFANLSNTVIVFNDAQYLDDTSLQTLELYFDKYANVRPNFVFIFSEKTSLHSKIKTLLRTPNYIEYTLKPITIESAVSTIKPNADDFIKSFYYEKIEENYDGSYLYFDNTIKYLKAAGVLIEFENKLLVKDNKAVVVPNDLRSLYKAIFKFINKDSNASLILAYSSILGARIDFKTLEALEIKDVEKAAQILQELGIAAVKDEIIYFNNYNYINPIIKDSLKLEIQEFLAKNVLAKLGAGLDLTTTIVSMGCIRAFKEEYLSLWKNSKFSILTGDFDAYLKNCLGFLSLLEKTEKSIEKETLEENKNEVYNNILYSLYGYSPKKIYFIENILLMDAIEKNDNDRIVKLSNLMLQGALISSNYTDATGLMHNILSRLQNPVLVVDGSVNTKFLLLSLVNTEILYNLGNYKDCINTAEEILSVLTPEIIEKVKPESFSTSQFIEHLSETYRLVCFAKILSGDFELDELFEKIKNAIGVDFYDKDIILSIKNFLQNKNYITTDIENKGAFSKLIFLIIQEIDLLKDDYKKFAQNIYQAKLLAMDINKKEIELFCDLLIAYSYFKIGLPHKAELIYEDVLQFGEERAVFNVLVIAKYFLTLLKLETGQEEDAINYINDTLSLIHKKNNEAKLFYALFMTLYKNLLDKNNQTIDSDEEFKLEDLKAFYPRVLG